MDTLYVVMPAYNEEENIRDSVLAWYSVLEGKKENSSLLAISMVFLLIAAPVWKVTGQDALNALKSPNKSIVISEDVKKVSDFIQSNTTPEDKIQVIGNYNFLYVYNRRQSASRYSYQEPVASISDKIRQEFLQDMETQLPKVVVVKDINNSFFMSLFPPLTNMSRYLFYRKQWVCIS